MPVKFMPRIVCLTLAASLSGPPTATAQQTTPWEMHRDAARVRYGQAEQLEQVHDSSAPGAYTDSARLFAQAAEAVPAGSKQLELFEPLVRKALVAFAQARRLAPPEPPCAEPVQAMLRDAVATCDAFLAVVDSTLGPSGRVTYREITEMRAQYQKDVKLCIPKDPVVTTSKPPPLSRPQPTSVPAAPVEAAPEPASTRRAQPDVKPAARTPHWTDAGLWTSVSLFGLFGAAALGTGLSRVSDPFHGAAFTKIVEEAHKSQQDADPTNDVSTAKGDDMCALARGGAGGGSLNASVAGRCDQYDALGKASIATGVLAGVSLVATATFLGLKLRRGRTHQLAAQRLRVAPGPRRSFGLTVGWSF